MQEKPKDAAAVFDGHMIMWQSPNSYDVIYKLQYPTDTQITKVEASYDAGATFSIMDSSKKQIKSASCYESNGNKKNTCTLDLGGGVKGKVFYLKIDSKHSTWNWFGNIKITDACPKGTKKEIDMSGASGIQMKRVKTRISFGPADSAVLFHDASQPGELHFIGKEFYVNGKGLLSAALSGRRLEGLGNEQSRVQELESELSSAKAEIRVLQQQMNKLLRVLATKSDSTNEFDFTEMMIN